MINRTGLYVMKQDVHCRTSNSRWTVKEGTQIEVTNVMPEKKVFYSYALGGWIDASIEAILVVPYHGGKLSIHHTWLQRVQRRCFGGAALMGMNTNPRSRIVYVMVVHIALTTWC